MHLMKEWTEDQTTSLYTNSIPLPEFFETEKWKLKLSSGCQTVPGFPNLFQKNMYLFNKRCIQET
jgi:hypothetical protein